MRKGPDGKTIRPGEAGAGGATQKAPRRSIRDRLLASEPDESDELPPTQMSGASPAGDESTTAPGQRSADPDLAPTVLSPTERGPAPLPPGETPRARAAPPPPAVTASPAPGADAEPPATRIYRPNRPPPAATPVAPVAGGSSKAGRFVPGAPVSGDFTIADPVVAWLVVVEGPGRGAALAVGYGNNRIGRAPAENISVDFGDEEISRENHATLTFDGRHRRFYLVPGQGRNLVYVNDEPVMAPLELKGGEDIMLGATKLRFVPFCGKAFDWYQK